jgi:serine/threonine protein kinase
VRELPGLFFELRVMSDPPQRSTEPDEGDYLSPHFRRLVEELWSELPGRDAEEGLAADPASTAPGLPATGGVEITIGRFQIRRELGRGGAGIVLLAFDPMLRREVALKVPAPEALLSPAARQRFLREARSAAALRHPNIVAIHEAGEAGPVPYIVMDYCEGGSLADWLAPRPGDETVDPRWAADLVARIADGVQHAHDRGILHRDLKPSNVLLDPNRNPLVTDFGLARSLDAMREDHESTLQGLPLGTIPYMAREAALGDRRSIGFATDVYGLGAILYEMLAGRRPFAAPSRAELLEQVLHAEAPSPRAFRPDLPRALEAVCLRCLKKEPSDRYEKPAELALALRRFLDEPSSPTRPLPAPRGRKRWALAVLALLAVIVALAVAGNGRWWKDRLWPDRSEALLRRLESADLAALPDLVPRIDAGDPATAERLARMYSDSGDSPGPKLAAALVLAKDPPGPRDYCYEQLLQSSPNAIPPLARLLASRVPTLAERLAREETRVARDASAEARDRRRANAACALIALGSAHAGWPLLRFTSDPEARSFLIHELGPAGIAPATLVDRLRMEDDPSIRRALILALGEVPDAAWPDDLRARTRAHLLGLYENDPDPGVHGSARWLLQRWGDQGELASRDRRLAQVPPRPGFRWRTTPLGLTMVTVRDPRSGRGFEVADTEVTMALYHRSRGDHTGEEGVSPGPDYPASGINYIMAAQFCNWLSLEEGLAPDALAYGPAADPAMAIEPVADQNRRTGYRLLTTGEYERACRAGTTTPRYFGAADTLLAEYAWYGQPYELRMHPVARLKPNDFGLFDMLGNADEVCQGSRATAGAGNQAAVCGGSVLYDAASIQCNLRRGPIPVAQNDAVSAAFGFRVARTRAHLTAPAADKAHSPPR